MAREAPSRGGRFIGVGWGFHDLLIYSRVFLALRGIVVDKVLGVSVVSSGPFLVTKPPQVGVDVDGISCPLHCPPLMGVSLAYIAFGLGRFFLAW
jgi:hypothetical protein